MNEFYEVCGVQIRLKDIKGYRVELCEYIYRPVYEQSRSVLGRQIFQFIQMIPYVAVLGESGHVASGAVYKVANALNIKALRSKKYRCRKLTGSEFDLYMDDVPVLVLRDDGGESDVYIHDEMYRRIAEPASPIIETVPALVIQAKRDKYTFYGNGIQLEDVQAEYEKLKGLLEQDGEKTVFDPGHAAAGIAETIFDTMTLPVDILQAVATGKKKGLVAKVSGLKQKASPDELSDSAAEPSAEDNAPREKKEILFMMLADCPYCRMAEELLSELIAENPDFADIPILRVDEQKEAAFANTLDYYFTPAFFVGDEKIMEGVPTREKVRKVLEAACG